MTQHRARYEVTIQDPSGATERTVTILADRDDQVENEVRQWYGDVVIIDWEEQIS